MKTDTQRGMTLMLFAMALFAVEDTFIKLLSANMPYTQIVAVLGAMGCATFLGLARAKGVRIGRSGLFRPIVLFRSVCEAFGSICFVIALALTELSSTTAIFQALPLAILLGAALFLGEPVGWRRWITIIIGFLGVMMVIRPGYEGFQPVSLLALVSVLLLAARDLVTRRMPADVRSEILAAGAFGATLVAALVLAVSLGQVFLWPGLTQWMFLLGCWASGVVAYAALVAATRQSEASALAPLRYARLVFALIFGVLIFHERPDHMTLIGAAIIVGSGCYAMWREAKLRRRHQETMGPASSL
ncbi:DMT family transporter [Falsirhodobacter sp. 20TX0035]|uniref:DMT family transporter n=1 Tax=Falsirhodobacter sp. 20TX0035 TaxID=3022019 RepID=UPI00232C0C91|nr:DMT family transporter [Falsirhodobacter sp. 20TX0035]MDB6452294.1 DMT family transporter [Falsirhodobacter sp. 20TX0035]